MNQARRFACRIVAASAILSQALLGVPTADASREDPEPSRPAKVAVNKTVPEVTPPPLELQLSESPTDAELFRARVFEEPLVPVGEATTPEQNAALARALEGYQAGGGSDRTGPLQAFLSGPHSRPWRASLQLSLGQVYVRTGRPSRAMQALADAWEMAKGGTDPRSRAVADLAVGELAQLLARLGHVSELQELLAEVGDRPVTGTAAELLQQGREGLALMETEPTSSFRCGPIALDQLMGHGQPGHVSPLRLADYPSTSWGTTLEELHSLAGELGLELQMAKRVDRSGGVLVPSVVHWSVGHFAALVEERDGRYLIKDPVFGGEVWMSPEAFDDEASGFALVPPGELPWGWRVATAKEAETVWGRGNTSGGRTQDQTPEARTSGGDDCCSEGMARYSVFSMLVGLKLVDTPVGYTPPLGPAVSFTVRYSQRDSFQPQIFTYWNLGSRWTTDWLGYVTDNPTNEAQQVDVYRRGGGEESHLGYSPATQSYAPHRDTRAVVVRVSTDPIRYERRLTDGSFEEYGQPDGALTFPRKVFLTRLVDATGYAVSLTYDESMRLVALTDAVGQVTTLAYEHPTDPLLLTKVTDPWGREAQFSYNPEGLLAAITDVQGLQSSFEYAGDFISTLTTPYGETSFEMWAQGTDRWIEITDALGGKERIEYRNHSGMPREPPPQGFSGSYLDYRNTFYWDKMAWYEGALGDYSKARILHWLHTADGTQTAGSLESQKQPLESRVWYAYPGQGRIWDEGSGTQPTTVARVLDDGTTQARRYEYNRRGMKVREIDPVGRETVFVYGTDGVPDVDSVRGSGLDLLEVRQANAGSPLGYDVQARYTYNANHQVLTAIDAAGETTRYTYTSTGQVETVTNALGETTTYAYYPDGQLETVTGPVPGTTTTYEYDGYGRLWRVTDPEGYQTTTEYDTFDRPTKVTYPDDTYEETVYDKLDAVKHRDRLGRWTQTFYDALRRPVATRDPAGRVVQQQFCNCGTGVDTLVDASGNPTTWERDLQGRVVRETRANGATYEYTYETTTSRLKSVRDPKGNVKTHNYNLDDTLESITYEPAGDTAPTPDVSFTYDPSYNRIATMTDGTGATTYAYHPVTDPPALGAGKLLSVDGPLDDDTIEYQYDRLGRVRTRQIGSAANTQTQEFDELGRLDFLTNPLGTFDYEYDGLTGRPESVSYPNGQVTTYDYDDNIGDHRLLEIHNMRAGGATLSRFAYTYDAVGNILTWLQQADSDPASIYEFGYDPADQLTTAILKTTDPTPQIVKRYHYAYDPAGNRTAEQIDDATTGASYNSMNQLTSQQAGGALVFKGTVSEPATVTVGGQPATVSVDNRFEGQAEVPEGTGQVDIVATDPSGNVRTSTYEVSQAGSPKTFTYDLNGNMTSDGTRTYEWDAENRLVAVKEGVATVASYTYNADGIRTSKTTAAGTTTYVLEGSSVVEERDGSGVTKHFQGPGIDNVLAMQDGAGVVTYLTRDHLGSVREHVDSAGTVVTLRRDYDPWGRMSAGASVGGWAFTGRENDPDVGLQYYRARYYGSEIGRFVSADPAGQVEGPNGYTYVRNRPVRGRDPSGRYTVAASAQPFQDEIDYAMEKLRELLPLQSDQCCLEWFSERKADPLPWTLPGLPPEIRVEQIDRPSGARGYTQAPFDFLVLDIDMMQNLGIDSCDAASVILHEFGHFAGKEPGDGFIKDCTFDCLNPVGADDY